MDIKDENGTVLIEGKKFSDHITNFYRSLYRLEEKDNTQGEIEDFLGPEIVNHPAVQSSILKEDEKSRLVSLFLSWTTHWSSPTREVHQDLMGSPTFSLGPSGKIFANLYSNVLPLD